LTTRRRVLGGLAATLVAPLGCTRPARELPSLTGRILGHEAAARGHRVRDGASLRASKPPRSVDVAIVGGGVAGLSAAWRLARAGFEGSVVLLELRDTVGGTSRSAESASGLHPLGAHYITLPNPACLHVRALLGEMGVITGYLGDQPRYDEAALCFAPQERIFAGGTWSVVPIPTLPRHHAWQMTSVTSLRGWLGGPKGEILFTDDGGKTWERRDLPSGPDQRVKSIWFSQTGRGFAAVENRNFAKRRHTLYESHDNGKHWWPVLGGMKSVNRLFAFGPGQLWAVGTVPGYVPNDLVAILKPE